MSQGLLKNFSWNVFGSFFYAMTQWLLIVGLNHLGDLEMVGQYSLGLAIGAPIMLFLNLKLRTIQSTEYGKRYEYNEFFSLRILTNLLFLVLIHIAAFFHVGNMATFITIILVGYMKVIESFYDVGYGLFQRKERLDIVARSYVSRGFFGTVFFLGSLAIFNNLFYALISLCIIWLISYFIYDYNKIKFFNGKQKFVSSNLRELFIIGLPLGVVALLGSLSLNFPRIVIERAVSLEALGVFSSIVYLNLILGRFVLSMGQALLPRLSRLYTDSKIKDYLRLFSAFITLLVLFSFALILISVLIGEEILTLVYGIEYQGYNYLLVLTMVYGLFYYLCVAFEIGLNSVGAFKSQVPVVSINITLIIILSVILIPMYGLTGAAYTLIFSSVIQLFIYVFTFVKKIRH